MFSDTRMDKLTLVVVLAVVLGYTQARPYYPYHGYHVPWYPVSPCNPYPPAPCNPYPYQYPCGGRPAPVPKPTPCNPQPSYPINKSPASYDQQTAEEDLLTQDIKVVRPVRQGSRLPQGPNQYPKIPMYQPSEYRALKRKPLRPNRFGNRRQDEERDYYGGYGRGMAPARYRDSPANMDDYVQDDVEYEEYDRGMGRGRYRDEGDYGHDEADDDDDDDDY